MELSSRSFFFFFLTVSGEVTRHQLNGKVVQTHHPKHISLATSAIYSTVPGREVWGGVAGLLLTASSSIAKKGDRKMSDPKPVENPPRRHKKKAWRSSHEKGALAPACTAILHSEWPLRREV